MSRPRTPSRDLLVDVLRRRRTVVVALGLALLAVLAFAVRSCGDDSDKAPPNRAARLVPADALAYVHLSTDGDRAAVDRALELAERFPSFPRVRDTLLQRLAAVSAGVSFQRDVRPWLGDEAGLALLNTPGQTAGSLLVVEAGNRRRAQDFLTRVAGPAGRASHRGTPISTYGSVASAFVNEFLVIGQLPGVRRAIELGRGGEGSLARSDVYERAASGLPAGRVLDAYASPDGVSRLLAPQGGALGAAGALLDQPGLVGTALALTPKDKGAQVIVHSVLDRRQAGRGQRPKPFEPSLVGSVPEDAMAYLGLTRLDRAAGRLLAAGLAGGGAGRQLTQVLERLRTELDRAPGVDVRRDVLPLFQNEVALWLAPAIPAPVLTLISATDEEDRTREAFARLQVPLARLLAPPNARTVPSFRARDVDGVEAFQLLIGPGVELDYAVFDGKLVVSTSLEGIRAVRGSDGSLEDNGSFETALGGRPDEVTSLVFLDFSELLRLGERTGLSDSRAYLAAREDLRRVRAVGAAATGADDESTTELFIEIP